MNKYTPQPELRKQVLMKKLIFKCLRTWGFKVSFFYEERQFVGAYTKVEW